MAGGSRGQADRSGGHRTPPWRRDVLGRASQKGRTRQGNQGAPRSGRWRDAKVFARNQGAGINVGLEANQQRGRELQGLWGAARSSPSPGRRSAFYSRINFSRASVVVFLRFVNFIQNTLYFKANLDVGGWLQTSNFSVRRGNEPLILTMMTCLENSSDCSFSA